MFRSLVARAIEEVLPPVTFHFIKQKQTARLVRAQGAIPTDIFETYAQLTDNELRTRITEERQRAASLDEKTFKLTFALSTGLSVLGLATTTILRNIDTKELALFTGISVALSVLYTMMGGFLAVGAMRTLPSFGYGTVFEIEVKKDTAHLTAALAKQETMNLIRHARNEAAYQCLRNGFIFLAIALSLFVFGIVLQLIVTWANGCAGLVSHI